VKEQYGISSDAIFDVAPDEATEEQKRKKIIKWDRKDMKYKKYQVENKVKIDKKLYPAFTDPTPASTPASTLTLPLPDPNLTPYLPPPNLTDPTPDLTRPLT
jgi:hypothetical protein